VRIVADRDRCVGAGQCVLAEPDMFDQSDEDGRVLLLAGNLGPAEADIARKAIRLCPSRAISLSEE
jgi:ferredoxin